MKGNFYAPASSMKLEETLKAHEPYAALVVSTTGLDNTGFINHSPIRVVIEQYSFNEETQSYQKGLSFDKMVKAPDEAIKEALKNEDYDVFVNGGIDKEQYLNGKDVLSPEAFKKEFDFMMSALQEKNTTLIVNGGIRFAEHYLEKIGASSVLGEMNKQGKVLDQTLLTQEYFQKHGISEKATLENLRNAITPSPKASFYTDKALMADFRKLSKEEFLKAHPAISGREYEITAKDADRRDGKIIGGNARAEVINTFVIKYGREQDILEGEWLTHQRESSAAYTEDLSEKGKQKYADAAFEAKIDTLVSTKVISPDDIMKGDSEFHKLIGALDDTDKKGIVVIHAASTGFRTGGYPKGFPIQFTAMAYDVENGHINVSEKPKGIVVNIKAPNNCIADAEKNINDPKRPYDTFKEAGIDREEYKNGVNVASADEAIEQIERFMKDKKDYTVITIGGDFTPTCMSYLSSNLSVCKMEDYIDVTQAIKDYAFLSHYSEEYPKNALFDEATWSGKKFSLEDIAQSRGTADIKSPAKKCIYAANLVNILQEQQIELFKPNEAVKEEKSEQEEAVSQSLEEEESFIDEEEEYDNVVSFPSGELSAEEKREMEIQEKNLAAEVIAAETAIDEAPKPAEKAPKSVEETNDGMGRRKYSRPESSKVQVPEPSEANGNRSLASGFERKPPFTRPASPASQRYSRDDSAFDKNFSLRQQPDVRPQTDRQFEAMFRQVELSLKQSEMLLEQVKVLANQNELLLEQNRTLTERTNYMAEMTGKLMTQVTKLTETLPQVLEDRQIKGNGIEAIEEIKEQISKISEGLSSKGQIHAVNANQALSRVQSEMEKEEKVSGKGRIA